MDEKVFARKYAAWQHGLLDVGRRNRMINYRKLRRSTLELVSPAFGELYRRVAVKGQGIGIKRPVDCGDDVRMTAFFSLFSALGSPVRLTTGEADAACGPEEAHEVAKNLRAKARLAREEQGIPVLYLSFGFLNWRPRAGEPLYSPLVLVPASLSLENLHAPYVLTRTDEDIVVNPTLSFVLEHDHGLRLPEFDPGKEEIEEYMSRVEEAVSPLGWSVAREANLGLLSFLKIVMYRDILQNEERLRTNPLIAALCGDPSLLVPLKPQWRAFPHDSLPAGRMPLVMPADASQQDAVFLAGQGVSFLLQGPPGTGKSQTIANIIAQAMAQGKKVLFVSEKMAALSVVHHRLEESGLADFCLSLHNYKADKRSVVADLVETLEMVAEKLPEDAQEQRLSYERDRAALNAYREELMAPRGALGVSAYDAIGVLLGLEDVALIGAEENALAVSSAQYRNRLEVLKRLSSFLGENAEDLEKNPWRNTAIRQLRLSQRQGIEERIDRLLPFLMQLEGISAYLLMGGAVQRPLTMGELYRLDQALADLRSGQSRKARELADAAQALLSGCFLLQRERFLARREDALTRLVSEGERIRREDGQLRGRGLTQMFRDRAQEARMRDFCRMAYREIGLYTPKPQGSREDFAACLEGCHALQDYLLRFPLEEETLSQLEKEPAKRGDAGFAMWKKEEAAHAFLKAIGLDGQDAQSLDWEALTGKKPDWHAYQSFAVLFAPGELDGLTTSALAARAEACRDQELLELWLSWQALTEEAQAAGLSSFLAEERLKEEDPYTWVDIYRKRFLSSWLDEVMEAEDLKMLRRFTAAGYRELADSFEREDARLLELAAGELRAKLCPGREAGAAVRGKEEALLRREAEKKRRHMPLRRLFGQIPGLLQEIKPCFMMSPLSVAYFLDADSFLFDLVIFDEASQILPEDAIGALARGKQAVIAGDTRQMPPTSFFAAMDRSEQELTEESEEAEEPGESILDEAASCLPSCTLLWHYRSRDESLIAFSNRELYGNRLITFPGCGREEDRGISYVFVPDGIYEGGGKNRNRKEAAQCVHLLEEHLQKHPERSLGIVAFSEKQQSAIEEEVLSFRERHPEYEPFFDENAEEPFFIKNLENVQGDERDTIILSVCYGRRQDGKLYMGFGPLSQAGGERRLNVAITRAKYNVKLVGSLLPAEIDMNRAKGEGVRLLRAYIQYAMGQETAPPKARGNEQAVDYLARCVAAFLAENGFAVLHSIGASACKVDLAVLVPGSSDRILAGIRCDSSAMQRARTARDREVTEPKMLRRMGWQLYPIYAAAWYKQPAREKARLLTYLRGLLPEQGEETAAATPMGAEGGSGTAREKLGQEEAANEPGTFPAYAPADFSRLEQIPGEDLRMGFLRRLLFVLEAEAPIHKELLFLRLAQAYGYAAANLLTKRMAEKALTELAAGEVTVEDDFVWLGTPHPLRAKAAGADTARQAAHIHPLEYRDALLVLARQGNISREDLSRQVLALFGLTSSPEAAAITKGQLSALVEEGVLEEEDGNSTMGEEKV